MRCTIFLALSLFAVVAQASGHALRAPPDLIGRSIDGDVVRLSDLRGKVVVVSFWASFCEPCLKELPILANLQKAAGADRLQVVAIDPYDAEKTVRKIAEQLVGERPIFVSDRNARVARASDVTMIPHLILIGADGHVAQVHKGYLDSMLDSILDEINALLAEQTDDVPAD